MSPGICQYFAISPIVVHVSLLSQRFHSRSPRFHNQENRRNTRDHTCTVSPVEKTNFANVANFNLCSIIDITLQDSGGSPWFRDLRLTRFSRREFPFLVDRSRRSPRMRRLDTLAPIRLARSRSHGCTTQQVSSLPFVQCTPLFLPLHARLWTRRSVKRSISFGNHAGRTSRRPRTSQSLKSILSTISERCIRRCIKRDFLRVLDLNLKLNFLSLGSFFQLFRKLKLRFFFFANKLLA